MTPTPVHEFVFPDHELHTIESLPRGAHGYEGNVGVFPGIRPLHIEVQVPAGPGPFPVVLWIHGGAWMVGSHKHRVLPLPTRLIQDKLLEAGFAFASTQYRLSGEAVWPAQAHDVKAAVRWLRRYAADLNVDPALVGAWGESAGGHLAAILATTSGDEALEGDVGVTGESSRIAACVNWYGPADLELITVSEPAELLTGGHSLQMTDASPIHHVSADAAPMLLIHGDSDSVVPLESSERLAAAYSAHGAHGELVVAPEAEHAFVDYDSEPFIDRSIDFLRRFLRRESSDA